MYYFPSQPTHPTHACPPAFTFGPAGELRFQELATLQVGWPPAVLSKGVDVPFTCGAPLSVWGPELAGYTRLPGRGVWTFGNYMCPNSLK
jgi:hypothetical protein